METPTPTFEKPRNIPLQWTAHRHPEHERSLRWYIGAGTVAGLCLIYALWTSGWSFAMVIVLIALAYAGLRKSPPALDTIRFDEDGCTWEGKLRPWNSLRDFWIVKLPEYDELHITAKRGVLEIVIQTGDIPSLEIRSTLSQFLPERADQDERLIDRIIRLTKL